VVTGTVVVVASRVVVTGTVVVVGAIVVGTVTVVVGGASVVVGGIVVLVGGGGAVVPGGSAWAPVATPRRTREATIIAANLGRITIPPCCWGTNGIAVRDTDCTFYPASQRVDSRAIAESRYIGRSSLRRSSREPVSQSPSAPYIA